MNAGLELAKTYAAIAAGVVSVFAAIVAFVFGSRSARAAERSAASSQKSAEAAQDALAENVHQGRLTITPRVTAVITEVFRDRLRGMALELVNSGRGGAFNVAYKVNVNVVKPKEGEVPAAAQEGVMDHLAAGARFEIRTYYNATPLLKDGRLAYEDIEATRYRSQYEGSANKWTFGGGVPAEPAGEKQPGES
jgi:hypothetical protein